MAMSSGHCFGCKSDDYVTVYFYSFFFFGETARSYAKEAKFSHRN